MYLIIGLIAALFLLVGQSYILTNNSVNTQREIISVSGKSEITVSPDEAEIYLKIVTKNNDAKLAQNENKELSNKVIAALKEQGVNEKDIQTQNFRLDENYRYIYEKELKEGELRYEATHTIKVKTSNLDSVGKLVDLAIDAGANGVDSVNYVLSDEKQKEVRAQALEKAIIAGREKAVSMTKTLGVDLGKVTNVQESNYYYTPYRFESNVKVMADGVADAGSNYFAPQDVVVQSTVQLQFEIE